MEESTIPDEQLCGLSYNNASPLTGIVMHNVRDLTVNGLTNLCRNYGSVVNVRKHHTNANMAFIEFATESDATMAIQQLNGKLGFGYRAQFLNPKPKTPEIKDKIQPEQLATAEADWEKESVQRRFKLTFLPPLLIKFPESKPLCSKPDYLSTSSGSLLRKVDPESFFCIQKVVPIENTTTRGTSDPGERHKKLNSHSKASRGGQFSTDKGLFTHTDLRDDELISFGAIQHCIVCNGYGFVYCDKCGTHYCSAYHQRQHLPIHDLSCPAGGAKNKEQSLENKQSDTDKSLPGTIQSEVLTRDTLSSKEYVYITAVLTHDCVFVRSADPAVEREYLKTIADCERVSLQANLATGSTLKPGQIYLAPGAPVGSCGRVMLIAAGPEESKCVFMEHGTLGFVKNSSLMVISDQQIKYRKVFIYKVLLADITHEVGELHKAIGYLDKLKTQRLEMKHRIEAGNMVDVQLRTAHGVSVNETINRVIIIPPIVTEKDHLSYIMYKDIARKEPTLGKSKQIMILNRSTIRLDGRVTWIAMDDLPYLAVLQDKLQHYGKKVSNFQRNFTPRIGELCLVRCMTRWYRGVCTETAGDCKPELFLCDYGCLVIADLLDIRKIPVQFATEVRTYDGIVKGLLEGKASGLDVGSEFLDVYLPENEPLMADISLVEQRDSLIETEPPEIYAQLDMHLFSEFFESFMSRTTK